MPEEKNTTQTLTEVLKKARPGQVSDFLEQYGEKLYAKELPFAAYMRQMFREKGLKQQDIFLAADIPEGYGYKLIAQEKHTRQRDVILRLCLAAGFDLAQVQKALTLYGMAPLYPRIPRDAVLMIAVNNRLSEMTQVDRLLTAHGMEALYACRENEL